MSGAGVVHYHSLHRPRSVPTALGPAPLVTYPHRPSQAGGYSRDCALLPPSPLSRGEPVRAAAAYLGVRTDEARERRRKDEEWPRRERGERRKKKNLGPVPGHTAARSSTSWAVHSRCHAMVLDLFGGRPDAHPPPGGRRWLLRSRAAGSESPVPCSSPNMADGSRLRPPGERGDSSAPSRTAATPPRPRSTAASLPSHLFFFCSSTTASGSHWRSPPLPAARSSQHRDPTQQRGLSDSVSLLPPGFRHQCNAVDRYGKKEAGTGEHLNTFNQINKHKWKAAAPHGRLPQTKHKLKFQAWSSLVFQCRHSSFYSFRSSSVGLETGEWRRCRSLSFTPPASLRSHGSRPRPTRHSYIFATIDNCALLKTCDRYGILDKTNEPGLMKMHINSTIFCFYLACDLYAEMDFGMHMIRTNLAYIYNTQSILKVEKRSGHTQPHPYPTSTHK